MGRGWQIEQLLVQAVFPQGVCSACDVQTSENLFILESEIHH